MGQKESVLIEALAAKNYSDESVFEREQAQIFGKNWLFACHVEKLADAGDFLVQTVAGVSLILVRDEADRLQAFYNICAHRAARLLDGEGCKKRISCPYHGWTYDLQGKLLAAPNAKNITGFDHSRFQLQPVAIEEIHGLIFVNLDAQASPLCETIPELVSDLKRFAPDLPKLTFVHRTEAYLKANWKVAIENYSECYHCELIHKALVSGILDFESYRIDVIGRGHRHFSRPKSVTERSYEFIETEQDEFLAWWLWPNFSFQNYPGGRVHVWQWGHNEAHDHS